MGNNVHQTTLSASEHLRDAWHGVGKQCAVTNDAQSPRPLCDQNVTAGKESDCPRMFEVLGYSDDPVVVLDRTEDSGRGLVFRMRAT